MALDTTVGGANSNSFADVAYATAYFANNPYATKWQFAQSFEKENALITAAMEMEKLDYLGSRVDSTQALKWPRAYVRKVDVPLGGSAYYENTEIPRQIKDAQCEWALALLTSNVLHTSELDKVSSISLGPLSVAVNSSGSHATRMPRMVSALLSGFTSTPRIIRR